MPRIVSRESVIVAILFSGLSLAFSQSGIRTRPLLTQNVDENNRITLYGNTHPAVKPENDRGRVADNFLLEHSFLLLKRAPDKQAEVDELINQLHDPKSANYHKWLTAAQVASRFGLAQQDIDQVTAWLRSHGFTVNAVYRANGVIDYSGTAAQVREAFHTEIHAMEVNAEQHFANVSDPQIPEALQPVLVGPVALHNFKPHPMSHPKPQYTIGGGIQAIVPLDLATIYNFNPLYAAGLSGQGRTIAVLEDTNLYSVGDWNTFRKTLGLSRRFPRGSFKQIHPQFGTAGNCADPGVNSNDSEATLDAEWATAAAPNASIVLASCADTEANYGIFIALQNMLTAEPAPPEIVSISYGLSESELGSDFNAYTNALYELGVLEGVSIFVSSGDEGAASSDPGRSFASHGIAVSGLASTPHNVAVGGTDFADSVLGENGLYWNPNNGPSYNSARSYIPEIPWNDSCASQLISLFLGFPTTYGVNGLCNSTIAPQFGLLTTASGSGGPSGCAHGKPLLPGVVTGTCTGYGKPSYQALVAGNPSDGVRDIPDVSLFAGNGIWGHYYVVCYSDPAGGGSPCDNPPSNWAGFGGTSVSAPIMAGIQALINQATGSLQGNPNFLYYVLAALEYGSGGSAACNSTLGNQADPGCIFYDVTLGDIDVNCKPFTVGGRTIGAFSCYIPDAAPNGVLSISNSAFRPAYRAKTGWDFATGIGTVNAYNLVLNWPGSSLGASARTIKTAGK